MKAEEYLHLSLTDAIAKRFIRPYIGSDEFVDGKSRYCLWLTVESIEEARESAFIREREARVQAFREESKKAQTNELAKQPFRFAEIRYSASGSEGIPLIIPIHTGEDRAYLPVGALAEGTVVSNAAFGLYDSPLWCFSLIASRVHLVWIATVCGKFKTDYRYSNTLGWNTFPVPTLTDQNKTDLTRCAEEILLVREAHFPATIADLYDPEKMPADLREAHDRNDETLERIYIGRRFKNDTERLEKLFEMYTQMTAKQPPAAGKGSKTRAKPRNKGGDS